MGGRSGQSVRKSNGSSQNSNGAGLKLNGEVFNPLDYSLNFSDTDLVSHSGIYGVGALGDKHWSDDNEQIFKSPESAVASIKTGDGNYQSKPIEIRYKSELKGYFAKDVNGELISTERVVAKNGGYVVQTLNRSGYELFENRRDRYFEANADNYNKMIRDKQKAK